MLFVTFVGYLLIYAAGFAGALSLGMLSKSIVDRLVLITGDSDFVPAMKFARREGVQVVLVQLGRPPKEDLRIHADEVRIVHYPPKKPPSKKGATKRPSK